MAERKGVRGGKKTLIDRRRIAQVLIGTQLGIERDWEDSEALPALTESFPELGKPEFSPRDARDMESCITKLTSLGCNRMVLNWCIRELGLHAEQERAREAATADRADMAGLCKTIERLEQAIYKFRRELLLVAEAWPEPLPCSNGLFAYPPDHAMGTLVGLLDSLKWVKGLAQAWQSPNGKALMKSKGMLYLLAYVWLHSQKHLKPETGKTKRKRPRATSQFRLVPKWAGVVADIAYLSRWKGVEEGKAGRKAPRDFDDSYKA